MHALKWPTGIYFVNFVAFANNLLQSATHLACKRQRISQTPKIDRHTPVDRRLENKAPSGVSRSASSLLWGVLRYEFFPANPYKSGPENFFTDINFHSNNMIPIYRYNRKHIFITLSCKNLFSNHKNENIRIHFHI